MLVQQLMGALTKIWINKDDKEGAIKGLSRIKLPSYILSIGTIYRNTNDKVHGNFLVEAIYRTIPRHLITMYTSQ